MTSTPMPPRGRSREKAALLAKIQALEPDIHRHLSRMFPDVAPAIRLTFQLLPVDCAHWVAVASTRTRPARRLFVKGPRKYRSDPGKMQMEQHLLGQIIPQISRANPLTRSPQLVASYPAQQLLLMEMVEGVHLYSLLFGLAGVRARGRLPELLGLCGEWLARFHALTQSAEIGNPFDWLVDELERSRTQDVLDRYVGAETRGTLCELVRRARDHYPDFRRPLCLLHRRFAPYHVLVHGQQIYVFDLETTPTLGYSYEDLAHFTTYYDILFPWRRAVGFLRMDLGAQKRTFLTAYERHASELTEPERIIMRFARLLAMVTYAGDLEKKDTWKRRLRAWVGAPWYRHRFRVAFRQELGALSKLHRPLARSRASRPSS